MVAAGCGGGDWDQIEQRWNLLRYAAMHRHWAVFGPPAYVAAALYLGLHKPKSRAADRVDDPEDLAGFLSGFPGASKAAG